MSLVITILLLIGIGIIYLHDNPITFSSSAEPEMTRAQFDANFRKFRETYKYDEEKYHELRYSFYKPNIFGEIKQRLKDELEINPSDDMVAMGVAAQEGKIPEKYIHSPCFGIGTALPFSNYHEKLATERKFFVWYNKELKAHGFPYDMMFARGDPKRNMDVSIYSTHYHIDEAPLTDGAYFWDVMIYNRVIFTSKPIDVL